MHDRSSEVPIQASCRDALAGVPRRYYSFREVSRLTGKHRVSVHRWVRAGLIPRPVYLTPSTVVFVAAEIDAWLDAREADRELKAEVTHA